MASTSERMLRLLSLLQSRRFWAGGELAARLEVSERTVRRDVERLRGLGYPVHAVSGVAGGYQMRSGAVMPPLLLDGDEAVAIAIGLSSAAVGALAGIEETSVRALSKIVQVMPPGLRRRVDALQAYIVPQGVPGGPTVDAAALAAIAQAARDGERLRFGYRTLRDVEAARHVEPHWLVPLGRRWYLVAWDLERGDWRTFRMDRLTEPVATGARFRPRELPEGQDAAAFVRASVGSVRQHRVVVLLSASVADVRRIVGRWAEVEAMADGRSRLTMRTDELHWPTLLISEIGAPFTVIEPDELKDHLRKVGQFLLSGDFSSRTELDRKGS